MTLAQEDGPSPSYLVQNGSEGYAKHLIYSQWVNFHFRRRTPQKHVHGAIYRRSLVLWHHVGIARQQAQHLPQLRAHGAVILAGRWQDLGGQLDLRTVAIVGAHLITSGTLVWS